MVKQSDRVTLIKFLIQKYRKLIGESVYKCIEDLLLSRDYERNSLVAVGKTLYSIER